MLRIAEHWYASDLGRQRQGNEDNYFVRAPLFVVADGMGGAQAGEVASEIAVRSFDEELPNGSLPEALVSVIEGANKRIHEKARADESLHGMGTTTTAAYVDDDEVVIAHVGDSRAYLLRDGDLVRLTKDHSLVGELVARGKLTEEQAEQHPQRSVITRALGPEANVQVDIDIFPAKAGDLFLLCSDGLTSMVHEPQLRPLFEEADSLETLGKRLIDAANAAGGRDNITVILFRLEEVGGASNDGPPSEVTAQHDDRDDGGETTTFDTFEGEAVSPRHGVSRPYAHTRVRDEEALHAGDVAHAVRAGDETEAEYRASGTVALSAVRPRTAVEEAPKRTVPLPDGRDPRKPPETKRKRRRVPGWLIGVLALVILVGTGFWLATQAVYFVGADASRGNEITIYNGLPIDLPLGIDLYRRYQGSGVTLESVPAARRATFTDHKLRSKDDAENLVIQLARGQIE
jgi:serine/threonine protein phosphatase PrpC